MLRIHGDRISLLAALTAHWADQQLQLPQALRPAVGTINHPQIEAQALSREITKLASRNVRHETESLQNPSPPPGAEATAAGRLPLGV